MQRNRSIVGVHACSCYCLQVARRETTTPLGGYESSDLPVGAGRRKRGGGLSTVRHGSMKKSVSKQKLDRSAMTNESLQSMSKTPNFVSPDVRKLLSGTIDSEEFAQVRSDRQVDLLGDSLQTSLRPSSDQYAVQIKEQEEEVHEAHWKGITPRATIFSTDLDAVEQQFDTEKIVRRRQAPSFNVEEVYNIDSLNDSQEGSGSTSMESRENFRRALQRAQDGSKVTQLFQYPRKAYLRGTVPDRVRPESGKPSAIRGTNVHPHDVDTTKEDLPSTANPHFPVDDTLDDDAHPAKPIADQPKQQPQVEYDAYRTRPHDHTLVAHRDVEYWDDPENRRRVDTLEKLRREEVLADMQKEGTMDNVGANHHAELIRKEALLFYRAYPINENIQDRRVRISKIEPADGSPDIHFEHEERQDIPLAEARAIARQHGLDLIRTGETAASTGEQATVGICVIADHRQHLRSMTKFKLMLKGSIQPPRNSACVEVPFRGGTHPFAMRFKSIGIAKLLIKRTPVRLTLTDFGTPREGFPVFQTILDEVKKQCSPLKAFHRASPIQSNYNEIFCFLHPSTVKSPKYSVDHPATEAIQHARDERIMEEEKETYFDGYYDSPSMRERLGYSKALEKGLAWAHRDEGLSLQKQRDIKVMLGYLPKGNKEIYAARGDVNVKFPFRVSHATSTEKWSYPAESNLEQSARAAALLGKRLDMDISDMHARQETEEHSSLIERFYYRMEGPALEVGEFKEALGLKSNRKKVPAMAHGWATLGMRTGGEEDQSTAAK